MSDEIEMMPAAPRGGDNPLGSAPLGSLIRKYATPAIIAMLVSSAYNITDQIFIGNVIGMYGNAATNVAFPLVQFCTALALLIGVGCASNFNINMGAGRKDEAARYAGAGIAMVSVAGITVALFALLFIKHLMNAFGATENVLPLAVQYTGITAFGIPFLMFTSACANLIRADGKPTYSMICTITGALINVFLDWLLMFPFHLGIAGAAYATVIGQIVSGLMVLHYMTRYRSVKITRDLLIPKLTYIIGIIKLGTASFINHFIMMAVQITMNNVLRTYGAQSIYGSDIPLAVAGVIAKVNTIITAFSVGTAQGCQPIYGFNTGAKNYARIKQTFKLASIFVLSFSFFALACLQLFPRQIVSIFGSGDALYYEFAERYIRIYFMMICIVGMQPLTVNFFTASGKAKQGILLSLTRQGLFLLPLLIILPRFLGLNGMLIAGPIADFMSVTWCVLLVLIEMRKLTALERAEKMNLTT